MRHPIQRFLTTGAGETHGAVRRWLGPERVAANRRAEVARLFERACARRDRDEGPRIVELGGELEGRAVIAEAGVRSLATMWSAEGATVETRRYVSVEARTFPLETAGARFPAASRRGCTGGRMRRAVLTGSRRRWGRRRAR